MVHRLHVLACSSLQDKKILIDTSRRSVSRHCEMNDGPARKSTNVGFSKDRRHQRGRGGVRYYPYGRQLQTR